MSSNNNQCMIMTTPVHHKVDSEDNELSGNSYIDNCENNDMLNDVDLVNGPNPWLPAYGYQIQHQQTYNRPTHEEQSNGLISFFIVFNSL